jgi:hypothetical protein
MCPPGENPISQEKSACVLLYALYYLRRKSFFPWPRATFRSNTPRSCSSSSRA